MRLWWVLTVTGLYEYTKVTEWHNLEVGILRYVKTILRKLWGFRGGPEVKSLPCRAGDTDLIPVWEDPTCLRTTKPMCHNYSAFTLQPRTTATEAGVPWKPCSTAKNHSYQSRHALEPYSLQPRTTTTEAGVPRSPCSETREATAMRSPSTTTRESPHRNKDSAQPKNK